MIRPHTESWRGKSLTVAFCVLVALLSFDMAAATQIAGGPPASQDSHSVSECPVLAECPSVGDNPTVVAWDGSALWVSHLGPPGPNNDPETLYRVDPATCAVLRQIPAPEQIITGLTWADGTLWCHPEQTGEFYQLDPSDGSVLAIIPAPSYGEADPDGSDLAWDGVSLWHSSYGADMIFRIDPSNGDVLESFPSPGPGPSGLDFVDGILVLADFNLDMIYQLDTDGNVLDSCASPSDHPWGIQCVDGDLWSGGLDTDTFYRHEFDLQSPVTNRTWGKIKAHYR